MKNGDKMAVELTRSNVLDCIMAAQNVMFAFEDEIKDESTTDERKRIARNSIEHRWRPVLDELKKQFAEQDGEEW